MTALYTVKSVLIPGCVSRVTPKWQSTHEMSWLVKDPDAHRGLQSEERLFLKYTSITT